MGRSQCIIPVDAAGDGGNTKSHLGVAWKVEYATVMMTCEAIWLPKDITAATTTT